MHYSTLKNSKASMWHSPPGHRSNAGHRQLRSASQGLLYFPCYNMSMADDDDMCRRMPALTPGIYFLKICENQRQYSSSNAL